MTKILHIPSGQYIYFVSSGDNILEHSQYSTYDREALLALIASCRFCLQIKGEPLQTRGINEFEFIEDDITKEAPEENIWVAIDD